jgi:hypothetical protein
LKYSKYIDIEVIMAFYIVKSIIYTSDVITCEFEEGGAATFEFKPARSNSEVKARVRTSAVGADGTEFSPDTLPIVTLLSRLTPEYVSERTVDGSISVGAFSIRFISPTGQGNKQEEFIKILKEWNSRPPKQPSSPKSVAPDTAGRESKDRDEVDRSSACLCLCWVRGGTGTPSL